MDDLNQMLDKVDANLDLSLAQVDRLEKDLLVLLPKIVKLVQENIELRARAEKEESEER